MYCDFYELSERPFDLTADPRFLFLTPHHRELLGRLTGALSQGTVLGLVTGDVGAGKTMLVHAAVGQVSNGGAGSILRLTDPGLTGAEFLEYLGLGFDVDPTSSKPRLLHALSDALTRRRRTGQAVGLIADEAQSLSDEMLDEIRWLTNLGDASGHLLPLTLVGQSSLAERLDQPRWWPLKQRIALRVHVPPLDLMETAAYVNARIQIAGGYGPDLFTRDAVVTIYQRTRGLPRAINVVCDNALSVGAANAARPVDRPIVLDVCRGLSYEPQAAAPAAGGPPAAERPPAGITFGRQLVPAAAASAEPDPTGDPRRGGARPATGGWRRLLTGVVSS